MLNSLVIYTVMSHVSHTHACTHARTQARTHARTHTHTDACARIHTDSHIKAEEEEKRESVCERERERERERVRERERENARISGINNHRKAPREKADFADHAPDARFVFSANVPDLPNALLTYFQTVTSHLFTTIR